MASEGQDRADALGWGRGFTPTDLRPSLANRTIPQEVTNVSIYDKEPGYYMILSRIIQDPANGLRRIHLPRAQVNMRCGQKSEVITSCMNEEGFHAVEVRNVNYLVDAPVTNHQLNELFAASTPVDRLEALLRHSLGYVCACLGEELI